MQQQKNKQQTFILQRIRFDSKFQSGNLSSVMMINQYQYNLWIGVDHNSNYKTWFYFSVQGIKQGSTVTFNIMNMNNQIKLYREGFVPVYKTQQSKQWSRIKIPIPPNAVVKGEQGFQITFKHYFMDNSKHYFAFTYPWTNQQNKIFIQSLLNQYHYKLFCTYQTIGYTYRSRQIKLLTITSKITSQTNYYKMRINNNQISIFPKKKGIFISARVHPGQTASSYIMNGIIKTLFTNKQITQNILQSCVFYIIPIINQDGVAYGNFRTDTQGKNLNRYYINPNIEREPEIYYIKQLLISMIKQKKIQFCLDLHAHVNKQGAFIYGNCTSELQRQMKVCLFPKFVGFNSQIFDYQSCNFSEKNMLAKDKGDQLSKEGASRVAIFKESGLAECWTLECNYNSARVIHKILQPSTSKNSGMSNGVLVSKIDMEEREEVKYLNIGEFEELGLAIVESIGDYYELRPQSRIFSSKIKNMESWKINTAIAALRLMPFRFDSGCRKILDCINSNVCLKQNIEKVMEMIGFGQNDVGNCCKIEKKCTINSSSHSKNNKPQRNSNEEKGSKKLEENKKNEERKSLQKDKQKEKQKLLGRVVKTEKYINKIPQMPKIMQKKINGKLI